jgi:hypothetical protein
MVSEEENTMVDGVGEEEDIHRSLLDGESLHGTARYAASPVVRVRVVERTEMPLGDPGGVCTSALIFFRGSACCTALSDCTATSEDESATTHSPAAAVDYGPIPKVHCCRCL